jgi:chorismate synthase
MNTFGTAFRVTSFGESHGPAVGCIIDGCPAGLTLELAAIQAELDRRRPGQSALTTPRQEADRLEVLSGLYQGQTTGAPVALQVRNTDQRPQDYDHLAQTFRPSHADFTWQHKYGLRDPRGGGRSSARETLARVAAGGVARQLLRQLAGTDITAWVQAVGEVEMPAELATQTWTRAAVEATPVRCPHPETAQRMISLIESIRDAGDTVGGIIAAQASPLPVGLGSPVFGKLHAQLGAAMLGINAVKGFEYGSGFAGARLRGSQHNDAFTTDALGRVVPATNHAGGVLGGISSGAPLYCRVAFKPVATLMQDQQTVDAAGTPTVLSGKGRHDPCVLPRAVPIVEAMMALVLADFLLLARLDQVDLQGA